MSDHRKKGRREAAKQAASKAKAIAPAQTEDALRERVKELN